MAINAKNIKVGVKAPTLIKPETPKSPTLQLIKERALKQIEEQKKQEELQRIEEENRKKEEERKARSEIPTLSKTYEPQPRYIHKEDGELIRHINRKSDYIRDIYEID